MIYYPHHIGDYMTSTAHLTILEDGAYRRLLDFYYSREAPIPIDLVQICRLIRARSREERRAVETILNEFFALTDAGWMHARCEEEIKKSKIISERARSNGKNGGRPRKQNSEKNVEKTSPEETQPVISGFGLANPEKSECKAPIYLIPNTNTKEEEEYSLRSFASDEKKSSDAERERPQAKTIKPNGVEWENIAPEDRAVWARAYPAIDVDSELVAALAWVRANPANKKSNYRKFLTNWLKRSQDRAPSQRGNSNAPDNRSRAQRVADKLDEIAKRDIAENGFTENLD